MKIEDALKFDLLTLNAIQQTLASSGFRVLRDTFDQRREWLIAEAGRIAVDPETDVKNLNALLEPIRAEVSHIDYLYTCLERVGPIAREDG